MTSIVPEVPGSNGMLLWPQLTAGDNSAESRATSARDPWRPRNGKATGICKMPDGCLSHQYQRHLCNSHKISGMIKLFLSTLSSAHF